MATVFRTGKGKRPSRAIQYVAFNGERRTIHLGKVGHDDALDFKRHFEPLLSAVRVNRTPDAKTAEWLAGLGDDLHEKLVEHGLARPRKEATPAPPLGEYVRKYIAQLTDRKPSTIRNYTYTTGRLEAFFGSDTPIDQITPDRAREWRAALLAEDLSEATTRMHVRFVKPIFNQAVDDELIGRNPFRKLVGASIASDADRYVTPEETGRIIEACVKTQDLLLFGLARLAGLRVPSESHILTWGDVDWSRGRLTVRSPKTERYEGHERRTVPIVPKLMAILLDAHEQLPAGADDRIITRAPTSSDGQLRRVLKDAGIEPWKDLFRTLRASRETEWKLEFPDHAVHEWLGNSEKVARKHYLMVPEHVYDQAAGVSAAKGAASSSRTDVRDRGDASGDANGRRAETEDFVEDSGQNEENAEAVGSAGNATRCNPVPANAARYAAARRP